MWLHVFVQTIYKKHLVLKKYFLLKKRAKVPVDLNNVDPDKFAVFIQTYKYSTKKYIFKIFYFIDSLSNLQSLLPLPRLWPDLRASLRNQSITRQR